MHEEERSFAKAAISEAQKSVAEDDEMRPKVGAVLVKDGEIKAQAYRGELEPGEHAEFILLEKKLADDQVVVGATVYTTLEPCTSRNPPKIPCTERLIERKVSRVVVGQLDPNPQIRGLGLLALREANIDVDLFPADLMSQLEDLNRDFTRTHRAAGNPAPEVDTEFLRQVCRRRLDEWYRVVNSVYWNRNYSRSTSELFVHLAEVIGGLSTVASDKKKPGVRPQEYMAKAIAWWLVLCGKAGVKSVERMIWDKFPGACAYCHRSIHVPDICTEMKESAPGVRWDVLENIAEGTEPPERISDWQKMFSGIYPAQQTESYGPSFARLTEELGELAESIRVFNAAPGYFLSEAADVFAWLMHVQNIIESKNKIPSQDRGKALELAFAKAYPDGCLDCGQRTCTCPPILASTIGRIAHEVPRHRGGYGESGRFMTSEKAALAFRPNT